MSVVDLISEISLKGGAVLLVLMTLIQVSPIKIDPWSYIVKNIGKIINKDVMDKVTALEEEVKANTIKVDKMEDKIDEQKAISARARILRFGDELSHNVKHSRDHFKSVLTDIDFYNSYCDKDENKEFRNHCTMLTSERIIETYKELDRTNGFL